MRKNWLLIGIALLAAVLAVAAIACDDDDEDGNGNGDAVPPATEEGAAPDDGAAEDGAPIAVILSALDDSGVTGSASLTAMDSDVEVVVEATGLEEANTYISGAYDSTSVDCTGGLLGSFSSTFTGDVGGVTYTVTATTVSDIVSISIRDVTETGTAPGTVVACGEVE